MYNVCVITLHSLVVKLVISSIQICEYTFHFGKRVGLAYVYSPVSVGKPSCDTPFRRSGPKDEEDHPPA